MAITLSSAKWLLAMTKKYNIKYDHTVMLGRQKLLLKPETSRWKKTFDLNEIVQDDGYAEAFLMNLQKENAIIDSIDNSPYEHATIVLDMNNPIEEKYKGLFDTVIDGGTLEHVFNYPQALKNSMELVKYGGVLIIMTPANNQCGHGFYQFSPELFFSILSEHNGYKLLHMSEVVSNPGGVGTRFTELLDNTKTGYRLYLNTKKTTYLFIVAKRIGNIPSELSIQQSDYVVEWKNEAPLQKKESIQKWKKILKKWDMTYFVGLIGLECLLKREGKKLSRKYKIEDLLQ